MRIWMTPSQVDKFEIDRENLYIVNSSKLLFIHIQRYSTIIHVITTMHFTFINYIIELAESPQRYPYA